MPTPPPGDLRVLTIGSGPLCVRVGQELGGRGLGRRVELAAATTVTAVTDAAIAAADLVVAWAGDDGGEAAARIDRACAEQGRPCLHLSISGTPSGERILVGPLFVPGRTTCRRCSHGFLACMEGGDAGAAGQGALAGAIPEWMAALAATAAVDEIQAWVGGGQHLRVASVVAIAAYDRSRRHVNIVQGAYTPATAPCAICSGPRGPADRESPAADGPARDIFIVGSQRSGTTMVALALGAHEQIESLDEDTAYAALAAQPGGERTRVYKIPNWTCALGLFAAHYSAARFLFMKRPAVQVVASMLTLRGFSGASWAELFAPIETRVAMAGFSSAPVRRVLDDHLDRAAGDPALLATVCVVAKQALVWEYRQRRLRTLAVDYERLVTDPRTTLAGVLDFAGLPWSERVLESHRHGSGAAIGQTERSRAIDAGSLDKYARVLGRAVLDRIAGFEQALSADLGRAMSASTGAAP